MECRVHKLIADVAVRSAGTVLLVRYRDTSRYDGQRGWFLPDDELAHGEHPSEAAARIVREQVGLDASVVRLSHVESFANGAWHVIFHLVADVDDPSRAAPVGNVADAAWFPIEALPPATEQAHDGWPGVVLSELTL